MQNTSIGCVQRHVTLCVMAGGALLRASAEDGRSLVAAAELDWRRRVRHCPEWDMAGLVGHMGGILAWMTAVVSSGGRVSRRALAPAPEAVMDLPSWYLLQLQRTLDALGSADPDSETWTFSRIGDYRAVWWQRRLAVEVAIHRWDAEDAVAADVGAPPRPLDGDVATAGVTEFVVEFLPGLLSAHTADGLSGMLRLQATDAPVEWWADLDGGGAVPGEASIADTSIRASRSDLLLWLTNRCSRDSLDVVGRMDVLDGWVELQR